MAIAFTVNTLPPEYNAFLNEAITALGQAVDEIRTWPDSDFFLPEATNTPEV